MLCGHCPISRSTVASFLDASSNQYRTSKSERLSPASVT